LIAINPPPIHKYSLGGVKDQINLNYSAPISVGTGVVSVWCAADGGWMALCEHKDIDFVMRKLKKYIYKFYMKKLFEKRVSDETFPFFFFSGQTCCVYLFGWGCPFFFLLGRIVYVYCVWLFSIAMAMRLRYYCLSEPFLF
jgi:hypothetical protein